MRGFAHFARLVALLTALGAATWAAFGLISTSNEFGSHHPEDLGVPKAALIVFGVSAVAYIALGALLKGEH
jgi:hypothetical protein